MPYDPIRAWRETQRRTPVPAPEDERESVRALRGTVFDADPVAAFRREQEIAAPEPTGFRAGARRLIDRGVQGFLQPFEPVRRYAEQLAGEVGPASFPISPLPGVSVDVPAKPAIGALASQASPFGVATLAAPLLRGVPWLGRLLGAGVRAGGGLILPESLQMLKEGLVGGEEPRPDFDEAALTALEQEAGLPTPPPLDYGEPSRGEKIGMGAAGTLMSGAAMFAGAGPRPTRLPPSPRNVMERPAAMSILPPEGEGLVRWGETGPVIDAEFSGYDLMPPAPPALPQKAGPVGRGAPPGPPVRPRVFREPVPEPPGPRPLPEGFDELNDIITGRTTPSLEEMYGYAPPQVPARVTSMRELPPDFETLNDVVAGRREMPPGEVMNFPTPDPYAPRPAGPTRGLAQRPLGELAEPELRQVFEDTLFGRPGGLPAEQRSALDTEVARRRGPAPARVEPSYGATPEPPPPPEPVWSPDERAALKRQGFSEDTIARMEARVQEQGGRPAGSVITPLGATAVRPPTAPATPPGRDIPQLRDRARTPQELKAEEDLGYLLDTIYGPEGRPTGLPGTQAYGPPLSAEELATARAALNLPPEAPPPAAPVATEFDALLDDILRGEPNVPAVPQRGPAAGARTVLRPRAQPAAGAGTRPSALQAEGAAPPLGRLAAEELELLEEFEPAARRLGYSGSPEEFRALFLDRVRQARELNEDLASIGAEQGDPLAIFREMAKQGGLRESDPTYPGEMKWLWSLEDEPETYARRSRKNLARYPVRKKGSMGQAFGVPGVFNREVVSGYGARNGLSLDEMAESFRLNPQGPFGQIQSIDDLLAEINKAIEYARGNRPSAAPPSLRETLKGGVGVRPNERYWLPPDEQLLAAPPESGVVPPATGDEALSELMRYFEEPESTVPAAAALQPPQAPPPAPAAVPPDATPGQVQLILQQMNRALEKPPLLADVPTLTLTGEDLRPTGPPTRAQLEAQGQGSLLGPTPRTPPKPAGGTGDPVLDRLLTETAVDLGPEQAEVRKIAQQYEQLKPAPAAPTPSPREPVVPAVAPPAPLEGPTTFEQLPANVRSFLTRQLKYSPDDINQMGVDEAIATGRNRVMNPSAAAAAPKVKPAVAVPKPLPREAVDEAAFDLGELERLVGIEPRRAAAKRTELEVQEPSRAVAGKLPALRPEQLARGKALMGQVQAGELKAEPRVVSKSEEAKIQGEQGRTAKRMMRLIEDGSPEALQQYEQEMTGVAERFWKRLEKGGTGREEVNVNEDGEILASGFGALQALYQDPKKYGKLLAELMGNPAFRGLLGGIAGYEVDEDEPLRGILYGAMLAAGTPTGYRVLRQSIGRVLRGQNPFPLADPKVNKDLPWWRIVFGQSAEQTVPEVFNEAQQIIKEFERFYQVNPSPAIRSRAQGLYRKDIAAVIEDAAREARAAKQPKKAVYLDALRRSVLRQPTAGQRGVQRIGRALGQEKLRPDFVEHHISANAYRVLIGYALDTPLQNLTQPLLTTIHTGIRPVLKAWRVSRQPAARTLGKNVELAQLGELTDALWSEVRGRESAPDVKGIKGFLTHPTKPLQVSDNYNRRVAYLAGLEHKGWLDRALAGATVPEAVDDFAQSVVRKTQGHTGPLGNNPFMRGPVGGSVKPFMKYPALFLENMANLLTSVDAHRAEFITSMLALGGVGHLMGINIFDLLMAGGRPLGIDPRHPGDVGIKSHAVGRAVADVAQHVAGTATHPVAAPPWSRQFLEDDLSYFLLGRYPTKAATAISSVIEEGLGRHRAPVTSTAPEHTGLDELVGLMGLKGNELTEARAARQEASRFVTQQGGKQARRTRDAKADLDYAIRHRDFEGMVDASTRLSPVQRREFYRRFRQTPYQRFREAVPRNLRPELDRRWREQLERR